MASLIDTNVLVYSVDPRDPVRQGRAAEVLRNGVIEDNVVLAHQCVVEFVAAVIRPRKDLAGKPLLPLAEARLEAEALLIQYPVLYPTRDIVQTALRGTAMYGLSWFDAHLWAFAEVYGLDEILSEDFEHGRHYGTVRAVNPFLHADGVHELPPLYAAKRHEETRSGRSRRGEAQRRRPRSNRARP